jgi:hypothetical protein
MSSAGWRALLLGLCAIVGALAAVEAYLEYGGPNSTSFVGQWGDTVGASTTPFHLLVLSTDLGHGADRAGLRPGDLIDIRKNTAVERFWLFGQPPTGREVTVVVRRDGAQHRFTILTQTITPLRLFLLTPIWLGYVWIALFAAIIAWRRSNDPQMRALCLLLVAYGFWQTTNQHYVSSDSLWMVAGFATVNAFGASAVGFWAACAGSFAPRHSTPRRVMQGICYTLVGISIAIALMRIVAIVTLWFDPIAFSSLAAGLPFALAFLAATACVFLAVNAANDAERQRAIWSLVPSGVLILVGFGAESLQGIIKSYDVAWSVYIAAAALNVLTPMVLTYVALNRRLLDIGFVLNRAAVFAIVSSILIAAFVIVEWVANEWLSVNHTTSAVVGMAVALALGVSMRYVHRFADRFVDGLLFRQRHEDEARLRRFAHEAAFITDRSTLLERTVETIKATTRADATIVAFDDRVATIDENDPALVALRAWHKPLDLDTVPDSALRGQFAFPMLARGQLIGAILCGTKQDSEVYAPDEFEALQFVADGVGNALSALSGGSSGSNGTLASAIAELRAAIADLRELKTSHDKVWIATAGIESIAEDAE